MSEAHAYTSSACVHRTHESCERFCKFCEEPCRCRCHTARKFKKGQRVRAHTGLRLGDTGRIVGFERVSANGVNIWTVDYDNIRVCNTREDFLEKIK